MSIGKFVKNLILNSELSNQQLLDKTLEEFPAANTSLACIAWYKSDLRKKGLISKRGQPSFKITEVKQVELTTTQKIELLKVQLEEQLNELQRLEDLQVEEYNNFEEEKEEETQE